MGWILCLVLLCSALLTFPSHQFPFCLTPGLLGQRLYTTGFATAARRYFEGSSITSSLIEFSLRPAQWKGLQAMYVLIQDYHLQHPLKEGRGPIHCVLIAVSLSSEKERRGCKNQGEQVVSILTLKANMHGGFFCLWQRSEALNEILKMRRKLG